jgi:hypothetical protein
VVQTSSGSTVSSISLELRQRPVREVANAVLLRLGRELDVLRPRRGGLLRRDRADLLHHAQHHRCAIDRGLGVGGGRIARRRLDQARDHRRLGQRQVGPAVAEELSGSGVDAIGPAAEIDLVEVELEDLVLGELAFERERQHRLAQLAPEIIFVRQEDGARDLLRDGRRALQPTSFAAVLPGELERAREADRIDAEVAAKAAILDRDHRVAHHAGDVAIGDPLAVAGAQRHDHRAVGGVNADHLPVGRRLELVVARQRSARGVDRDHQRDQRQHGDRHARAAPAWLWLSGGGAGRHRGCA